MSDARISVCPTCYRPTVNGLYRSEEFLKRDIEDLRARITALEAREARLVEALEDAKGTLGMLRSIVDSGERWTGKSTGRYFDTITTIRATLDAVKGGSHDVG